MAIISQYQAVISGQLITAALWNGMELNIINNGLIPTGIEDYSATDAEMQTQTDPYPSAVISRGTSLAGELERIRYQIAAITGETYWYIDPDTTLAGVLSHTHESPYTQIPTAGIADSAVTTAKIADANVTTAKILDANVTTAKIADANVTTAKIADSNVTTAKIADANVTTSKIATSGVQTGNIADSNVTTAKIADANITTVKIADSNITTAKIADNACTHAKVYLDEAVLSVSNQLDPPVVPYTWDPLPITATSDVNMSVSSNTFTPTTSGLYSVGGKLAFNRDDTTGITSNGNISLIIGTYTVTLLSGFGTSVNQNVFFGTSVYLDAGTACEFNVTAAMGSGNPNFYRVTGNIEIRRLG